MAGPRKEEITQLVLTSLFAKIKRLKDTITKNEKYTITSDKSSDNAQTKLLNKLNREFIKLNSQFTKDYTNFKYYSDMENKNTQTSMGIEANIKAIDEKIAAKKREPNAKEKEAYLASKADVINTKAIYQENYNRIYNSINTLLENYQKILNQQTEILNKQNADIEIPLFPKQKPRAIEPAKKEPNIIQLEDDNSIPEENIRKPKVELFDEDEDTRELNELLMQSPQVEEITEENILARDDNNVQAAPRVEPVEDAFPQEEMKDNANEKLTPEELAELALLEKQLEEQPDINEKDLKEFGLEVNDLGVLDNNLQNENQEKFSEDDKEMLDAFENEIKAENAPPPEVKAEDSDNEADIQLQTAKAQLAADLRRTRELTTTIQQRLRDKLDPVKTIQQRLTPEKSEVFSPVKEHTRDFLMAFKDAAETYDAIKKDLIRNETVLTENVAIDIPAINAERAQLEIDQERLAEIQRNVVDSFDRTFNELTLEHLQTALRNNRALSDPILEQFNAAVPRLSELESNLIGNEDRLLLPVKEAIFPISTGMRDALSSFREILTYNENIENAINRGALDAAQIDNVLAQFRTNAVRLTEIQNTFLNSFEERFTAIKNNYDGIIAQNNVQDEARRAHDKEEVDLPHEPLEDANQIDELDETIMPDKERRKRIWERLQRSHPELYAELDLNELALSRMVNDIIQRRDNISNERNLSEPEKENLIREFNKITRIYNPMYANHRYLAIRILNNYDRVMRQFDDTDSAYNWLQEAERINTEILDLARNIDTHAQEVEQTIHAYTMKKTNALRILDNITTTATNINADLEAANNHLTALRDEISADIEFYRGSLVPKLDNINLSIRDVLSLTDQAIEEAHRIRDNQEVELSANYIDETLALLETRENNLQDLPADVAIIGEEIQFVNRHFNDILPGIYRDIEALRQSVNGQFDQINRWILENNRRLDINYISEPQHSEIRVALNNILVMLQPLQVRLRNEVTPIDFSAAGALDELNELRENITRYNAQLEINANDLARLDERELEFINLHLAFLNQQERIADFENSVVEFENFLNGTPDLTTAAAHVLIDNRALSAEQFNHLDNQRTLLRDSIVRDYEGQNPEVLNDPALKKQLRRNINAIRTNFADPVNFPLIDPQIRASSAMRDAINTQIVNFQNSIQNLQLRVQHSERIHTLQTQYQQCEALFRNADLHFDHAAFDALGNTLNGLNTDALALTAANVGAFTNTLNAAERTLKTQLSLLQTFAINTIRLDHQQLELRLGRPAANPKQIPASQDDAIRRITTLRDETAAIEGLLNNLHGERDNLNAAIPIALEIQRTYAEYINHVNANITPLTEQEITHARLLATRINRLLDAVPRSEEIRRRVNEVEVVASIDANIARCSLNMLARQNRLVARDGNVQEILNSFDEAKTKANNIFGHGQRFTKSTALSELVEIPDGSNYKAELNAKMGESIRDIDRTVPHPENYTQFVSDLPAANQVIGGLTPNRNFYYNQFDEPVENANPDHVYASKTTAWTERINLVKDKPQIVSEVVHVPDAVNPKYFLSVYAASYMQVGLNALDRNIFAERLIRPGITDNDANLILSNQMQKMAKEIYNNIQLSGKTISKKTFTDELLVHRNFKPLFKDEAVAKKHATALGDILNKQYQAHMYDPKNSRLPNKKILAHLIQQIGSWRKKFGDKPMMLMTNGSFETKLAGFMIRELLKQKFNINTTIIDCTMPEISEHLYKDTRLTIKGKHIATNQLNKPISQLDKFISNDPYLQRIFNESISDLTAANQLAADIPEVDPIAGEFNHFLNR